MHKCNNKKPHFKTILSKPDIFNGTDAHMDIKKMRYRQPLPQPHLYQCIITNLHQYTLKPIILRTSFSVAEALSLAFSAPASAILSSSSTFA